MSPAEPWLVYGLIFAAVAGAVLLAQHALRVGLVRDRRMARRFSALDGADSLALESEALRRGAAGGGGWTLVASLRLLILQSGVAVSLPRLFLVVAALGLVLALVLPLPPACRLAAGPILAAALAYLHLRRRRAARLARFGEQLPEIIDVIVRSLRAGHPLPVSLALVARETPAPAGPEFAAVVDEINYGRGVGEALEQLERRVGYPELRFFVSAIAIAQQTGGNLVEILSRLSRLLRERFRLRRRVRALSAEGRFSGYALSALPLALFGLIHLVSADYYAEFWASPSRTTLLVVAAVLLVTGNLVIYKMVRFRV